jgi:hypothetical protein
MTIRAAFVGAASLILLASSGNAQGRPRERVVLSEAVMKSMIANKPKSKTPLAARVGMVRRSSVVPAKPGQSGPTSVQEVSPASRKK